MNHKLFSYFVLTAFAIFQLGSCKRKDTAPVDNVYRFSETMTVDGRVRTYTLNLPPTYYTGVNFSLVIALHGGGGDALQFESTSRLTAKANEGGFVVVYPEGVKSTGFWEPGAGMRANVVIMPGIRTLMTLILSGN